MSKVSFRARQIDFNKPLPIIKHGLDLVPEFNESTLINRGIPHIPSGMEKEEENEHHFIEVLQSLQTRKISEVKIPVPDIIDRNDHYRPILLSDDENPDYDMDSDDEEWLAQSELGLSPQQFEHMMDRLEHGCGQKEGRDGSTNADPYVAFRRRSEKMQTRKNRKNDEQSYEKMLLLRDHMSSLERTPRKRKSSRGSVLPEVYSYGSAAHDTGAKEEQFAFLRLPGCRYVRPRDATGVTNNLDRHNALPPYTLATVSLGPSSERRTFTGYIRRRLGRGGRIVYDRLPLPQPYVDYFGAVDSDLQSRLSVRSPDVDIEPRDGARIRYGGTFSDSLSRRLVPVVLAGHGRLPTLAHHCPSVVGTNPPPFQSLTYPFRSPDALPTWDPPLDWLSSLVASSLSDDHSDSGDTRDGLATVPFRPPPDSANGCPTPAPVSVQMVSNKPAEDNPIQSLNSASQISPKTDGPVNKARRSDPKSQNSKIQVSPKFASLFLLSPKDPILSTSKNRCLGDLSPKEKLNSASQLQSPSGVSPAQPIFQLPI